MTSLIPICLLLFSVFFLHGCAKAPVPEKSLPPPFNPQEIDVILEGFETQRRNVRSCFGSGRLSIQTREGADDVNILVAGQKDPFRVKLEITHPWGRPLLHIVMNESTLQAVVFHHKRVYRGKPMDALPGGPLPIPLAPDIVWSLIRGFPIVAGHTRAASGKGGEIALLDEKDAILEVITFGSDDGFPVMVSFFEHAVDIHYSPFDENDGIQSARLVKLVHPDSGTSLELELNERVFNRAIPPAVFELDVPRGFEVRELSALGTE